jgi:GNAT superfamily N-acetyltransferase
MTDYPSELITMLEQMAANTWPAPIQQDFGHWRLGPKACFLQICDNGATVGLGTAVLERGWAGFTNIVTAQSHRGKGVGTLMMRALAAWCHEHGAAQLYLQVLRHNTAAIHLYSKLGFTHLYNYHYRTRGQG